MPPAVETPARLWNVAGLLRGGDAELSKTAVVASAHYDHEGLRPENEGDKIMNGANDDASGTAVLLETARALASMPARPKRSIIFLAVAAEEKGVQGLLGSLYYAKHPLWPLENTVANLNFEMFGRTEEGEYTKPGQMTMTGAGFSTVTDVVKQAAADEGLKFFVHPQGNEEFFARSDNFAFAKEGIPAHTITPGFSFQQYHQVGDEWQTLDYDNMQRAARVAALATLRLADAVEAPKWDESNPAIKKYAERRKAAPPVTQP
jgi:Zn-dependent M28 family amino/carboxypeptidase